MADLHPNGSNGSAPRAAQTASRRRSPLPLAILAAIFIIAPFLTWYGTWFGRKLSDQEITQYLADDKNPRHVQHALSQVAERMDKHDEHARQWYPQLVKLAGSRTTEFRSLVAWLMGKDHNSEEFHNALVQLLSDDEPIVRRNAALSLVTFNDARGRTELRAMLQPYTVASNAEGQIVSALGAGSQVAFGSLLARVNVGNGQSQEIRSPLPGKIAEVLTKEGSQVKAGEPLCSLLPDSESVWEALRALYFVGQPEDLPEVERYSQTVEGMPERIKQQAARTVEAIRSRSSSSGPK